MAYTINDRRENLKLIGFMIAAVVFFIVTLFVCFFIVIVAINDMNIPANDAPNMFMLGLAPPSIGTFLLFTRVFGRFI